MMVVVVVCCCSNGEKNIGINQLCFDLYKKISNMGKTKRKKNEKIS